MKRQKVTNDEAVFGVTFLIYAVKVVLRAAPAKQPTVGSSGKNVPDIILGWPRISKL